MESDYFVLLGRSCINAIIEGSMLRIDGATEPAVLVWNGNAAEQIGERLRRVEDVRQPGIAAAPDGTKPCGYCGNENLCVEIHTEKHPGMTGFAVRCGFSHCGARGPVRAVQMDAVAEWNAASERIDCEALGRAALPSDAGRYERKTTDEEREKFESWCDSYLGSTGRIASRNVLADLASCERALQSTAAELAEAKRERDAAEAALSELHAQVRGECPSLLNEDSGGDGELDLEIEELLIRARGRAT